MVLVAGALVFRRRNPMPVLVFTGVVSVFELVVGEPCGPGRDERGDRALYGRLAHRPAHHLAGRPADHDRADRRGDVLRLDPLVHAGEPRHLRLDRDGGGRRRCRAQPPRLRRRDKGTGRARRAHPRGGGPAAGRRGAAADRPRSARCGRAPHRPGQCAGRSRVACHGQTPRPGQGGPRPCAGGQPLRAQRTACHGRTAAAVRRPRGPHRTGPRPGGPRRTGHHLPPGRTAGRGGPRRRRRPASGRRRPRGVPDHPGGADQCAEARGLGRQGRGQRDPGRPDAGGHGPRQRRGPRRADGRRRTRSARDARAGHGTGRGADRGPRYGGGFRVQAILPLKTRTGEDR